MSKFINPSSTRVSDDALDDDTDDGNKRKTRNLSEKKRRDQFNILISELSTMVSTTSRKMDKSTVLKSTISFLKNHNDFTLRSKINEIQEDWKPSFLSNEEFTHLFLEALDGFIMVFTLSGRILYASESITSLLGYFPTDLLSMTLYDIVYDGDHSVLYNLLLNPSSDYDENKENEIAFTCHCRRGGIDVKSESSYEVVQFIGNFRSDLDSSCSDNASYNEGDARCVFVGTGRLQTPQLIRDLSVIDSSKCEFTSRHSLEWKFLFLDHRAPPIIGYLPFEVLGTSGYDYYHIDDLDKVVACHEALMQKGEGTSCYYRFLTKGQQWIWLQTRFYITYHQWNSKPEFVVCTHRVVSFLDVLKPGSSAYDNVENVEKSKSCSNLYSSSKSRVCKLEKHAGSDTNSVSEDSPLSMQSQLTSLSPQSMQGNITSTVKSESSPSYSAQSFTVIDVPSQPPITPITPKRLEQLQKRQEELQQRIVLQQSELRRVTEQLFVAKYGMFPPVINVSVPYAVTQTVNMPNPELYITHMSRVPPVIIDPFQAHGQPSEGRIPQRTHPQPELIYSPVAPSPNPTHTSQ